MYNNIDKMHSKLPLDMLGIAKLQQTTISSQ